VGRDGDAGLGEAPGRDPLSRHVHGRGIALSPDGRLLADAEVYESGTVDKKGRKQENVGLRLRSTSVPPRSAPLTTIDELDNGVAAIAFSPTEPVLAVSDMNGYRDNNRKTPVVRLYDEGGTLRLWRVEGHRLTEELSRVAVESRAARSPSAPTEPASLDREGKLGCRRMPRDLGPGRPPES
jgi:hypothetical protein